MDKYWVGIPSIDTQTTSSAPNQSLAEAARRTFMRTSDTSYAAEDDTEEPAPGALPYDEEGGTQIYGYYPSVSTVLFLPLPDSHTLSRPTTYSLARILTLPPPALWPAGEVLRLSRLASNPTALLSTLYPVSRSELIAMISGQQMKTFITAVESKPRPLQHLLTTVTGHRYTPISPPHRRLYPFPVSPRKGSIAIHRWPSVLHFPKNSPATRRIKGVEAHRRPRLSDPLHLRRLRPNLVLQRDRSQMLLRGWRAR